MAKDYTKTGNPRSLYIAALHREFPDWVKGEAIPDEDELTKLSSSAFCDRERRLLPCHTPAATFFSAVDSFFHPDLYDDATADRVKQACAYHEIEDDVAPYLDVVMENLVKRSSVEDPPDSEYALHFELPGRQFRLFPLHDAQSVADAALSLEKMAASKRIPHELFVYGCKNITKKAEDLGILEQIRPDVRRMGEDRDPDWDKAASAINSRKPFLRHSEEAERGYADLIKKGAEGQLEDHAVVAGIRELDIQHRIPYRYESESKGVVTPEEIVYSGESERDKRAAICAHVSIGQALLPLSSLSQVPDKFVDLRLSKTAAAALRKARACAEGVEATAAFLGLGEDDVRQTVQVITEHAHD